MTCMWFNAPLPVPLSLSWPLVVLLCSFRYGFPLTYRKSSPSFFTSSVIGNEMLISAVEEPIIWI